MPVALVTMLLFAPGPETVEFGTTAAERVRLLRHPDAGIRRRAALLLAHAPADEAIAGLILALRDGNAHVRAAAAAALGTIGDARAVPFFVRRLAREPSSRALAALLLALGECGETHAARFARPFLDHPARAVRAAAARAIGRIGDAGQRKELWAALRFDPDDPGFTVRSAVLAAFVALEWREDVRRAITELEAMGAHRHWLPRGAILAAVGAAGLHERGGWLREQLRDEKDPRVLAAGVGSLARLGFRDEVHARLEEESPDVRRAALVALQEAGDARALDAARRLVRRDPDVAVRLEAALVLHAAGLLEGDRYLVDALRARNALVWITALSALERRHRRSFGRDPDAWKEFLSRG